MNNGNLKPTNTRTKSEQRDLAKKAGIASGEARREKKQLQESFRKLLAGRYEVEDKKLGGYDALAASMIKEALTGDVKAFIAIRDTIGEKPKDTFEVESESINGIKIKFVDKSNHKIKKEKDPKIIGDYTPPSNVEDK